MRLLLDTHALPWFLSGDPKLSSTAKAVIEDPANERYVSPISLLEIALKTRLGKITLAAPFTTVFPSQLRTNDIHLLPCEVDHIAPLTVLPFHHRDPSIGC